MEKIIFSIFLTVGLCAGFGAYHFASSTLEILEKGVEVKTKVIHLEEVHSSGKNGGSDILYRPTFEYVSEGKTHTLVSPSASYPAPFEVGEVTTITLHPNNPNNFVTNSFFDRWFEATFFSFFALSFGSVGFFGWMWIWKKARNKEWLSHSGMPVMAKVIKVDFNKSLTINGRNPWRIEAQWHSTMDNKVYVFYSDNFWFDPSQFVGSEVEVLINQNNPKIYNVVVRNIPKAA